MANELNKTKVEIFGERYRAVVQPDAPMRAPKNERLRV
jgi:hypothetical protein